MTARILTPAVLDEIVRLFAEGRTDREIVAALGLSRATVRTGRAKLGLALSATSRAAQRRANAAKAAAQIVRNRKAFARRHGWPEDLPLRCVQILDALAEYGPATALQLAERIGMPAPVSRNSLLCAKRAITESHTTYLSFLRARRLVVPIPLNRGRSQGSGRTSLVYTLTLTAVRIREECLARLERTTAAADPGTADAEGR